MDCGGCFSHGIDNRVPVSMKARHFARRFSFQNVNKIRRKSSEINAIKEEGTADDKETEETKNPEVVGRERRCASGCAVNRESQEVINKKYRIVIMGASKVGKTAIINQFLYDTFIPKYSKTIEEMHHGEYEVSNMSLTLEILDTSGTHEFPAMRELNVKAADAFILVYSVTDVQSFEEVRSLREMIHSLKDSSVPMVIVGNKVDLKSERLVPIATAETTSLMDWQNGFIETSAKENFQVVQIFKELLNQAKIKYALSPAVKRRRQSMPNVGLQVTPNQLSHLNSIKQNAKRNNSCSLQ